MDNFWPTFQDVFNNPKDSPLLILQEQAKQVSTIDPSLSGGVEEIFVNENKPLSMALPSIASVMHPLVYTPHGVKRNIAYKLTINRIGYFYKEGILRIRYDLLKNYPVEVADDCRRRDFILLNRTDFESCLRDIFHSKECMAKIKYIFNGNII